MEHITKEDIGNIINSPVLNNQQIIDLVEKEMDIKLPPKAKKEEWIEIIFNTYNTAIKEVESHKQLANAKKTIAVKKKSDKLNVTVSRKQFIIELIEEGIYNKEEITERVTVEYGYNITGKSPKTRISRTLRELKSKDLLDELSDGVLRIKTKE